MTSTISSDVSTSSATTAIGDPSSIASGVNHRPSLSIMMSADEASSLIVEMDGNDEPIKTLASEVTDTKAYSLFAELRATDPSYKGG
jgi:hypothetical protein